MAANHPECRTRRIEQDAVVRNAVPPRGRLARIAVDEIGSQVSPPQILTDPGEPLRIDVDRGQPREVRLSFRNERGLAARRGAGVENALTGGQRERKCNALRSQILHGHEALRESRQVMHIAGRVQRHCLQNARVRPPANPCLLAASQGSPPRSHAGG